MHVRWPNQRPTQRPLFQRNQTDMGELSDRSFQQTLQASLERRTTKTMAWLETKGDGDWEAFNLP